MFFYLFRKRDHGRPSQKSYWKSNELYLWKASLPASFSLNEQQKKGMDKFILAFSKHRSLFSVLIKSFVLKYCPGSKWKVIKFTFIVIIKTKTHCLKGKSILCRQLSVPLQSILSPWTSHWSNLIFPCLPKDHFALQRGQMQNWNKWVLHSVSPALYHPSLAVMTILKTKLTRAHVFLFLRFSRFVITNSFSRHCWTSFPVSKSSSLNQPSFLLSDKSS